MAIDVHRLFHLGKAAAVLAFAACFGALYLHVADLQDSRNNDMSAHDQSAYLNFAKKAHDSGFKYSGTRNRMPLYPHLQALFYSPDLSDDAFFQQGKRVNVVLSLFCLSFLGFVLFAKFSKLYAAYALLVIAFLAFAYKAPYFQAEILFYTLFGIAFMLSLESLIEPRWYKSAGVGLLFALAFYSKASASPGLGIFLGSYGLLVICKQIVGELTREQLRQIFVNAIAAVVAFVILLYPYIQESKEKYGAYFYNVNTLFYVWFESWEDAAMWAGSAAPRDAWPDLPDDEIPSPGKYIAEHSAGQIIERLRQGFVQINWSLCYGKYSRFRYGLCSQIGISLLVLVLCLPLMIASIHSQTRKKIISASTEREPETNGTASPVKRDNQNLGDTKGGHGAILRRRFHIVSFVIIFFVFYLLSFAWYMPIIGKGPRTFLTLLIPLLWSVGSIVHSPQIQSLHVAIKGRNIRAFTLVNLLMLLTLFYEIYQVVTWRAGTMDGGN